MSAQRLILAPCLPPVAGDSRIWWRYDVQPPRGNSVRGFVPCRSEQFARSRAQQALDRLLAIEAGETFLS